MNFNFKTTQLLIAGIIAAGTAIWHWLCIWGGYNWFVAAHAPPIVLKSVEQGSLLAPISTVILGGLFFLCSVFAFSSLGLIRKLPFLRSALLTIAVICLLRGGFGLFYLAGSSSMDKWELVASSVWFYCGICFLLGFLEQLHKEKPDEPTE